MEVNFEQAQQRLNELTPELARLRLELGQSQRENETARVELSRLTAEKDREVRSFSKLSAFNLASKGTT